MAANGSESRNLQDIGSGMDLRDSGVDSWWIFEGKINFFTGLYFFVDAQSNYRFTRVVLFLVVRSYSPDVSFCMVCVCVCLRLFTTAE